ncbi:MAG: hypothetical protein ACJ786_27295 [Catenulispora sp.]
MSESLERRYRKLLRMLPKHYRESRGEEMLGALMEGSDEGRRWPEAREALSVAGLSLRTRFAVDDARRTAWGLPRWGQVARAVALIGSALLAFDALNTLVGIYGSFHTLVLEPSTGHVNVRWMLHAELPALWLVVYLLLILGRWAPARLLAGALFLFSAATLYSELTAVYDHLLLAMVTAGATLVCRGADARKIGGDGYLPAAGTAVAAAAATGIALAAADRIYPDHYRPIWDVSRVLFLQPTFAPRTALFYELTAVLLGVIATLSLRSPVWPLAAASVGAALVLPSVGYLAGHGGVVGQGLHRVLAVEGALAALAGLAVLKQRRAVRRGGLASAG